jgi:hypothetical protein
MISLGDNKMFAICDNVLNPYDHKDVICTIVKFSGYGKRKRAILTPYTSKGYPSVNSQKWVSANIGKLHQVKKYPKLLICPKCQPPNALSAEDRLAWSVLNIPLRWLNINDVQCQCKKCKKWFNKENLTRDLGQK